MNPFQQINLKDLKGYLIFLDIDGTLVHDSQEGPEREVVEKVKQLKEANEVYLCSNSPDHMRNKAVATQVGAPYLETDLRKPDKKILELVEGSSFEKKLVIGDKLTTDGLFAWNIGADFVKVERLRGENDKSYIKFLYWVDDALSKVLKL